MTLAIVQWREYGDDEDQLDLELFPADEDDPVAALAERRAEELDLHHGSVNAEGRDEDGDDIQAGDLMVINSTTLADGEEIIAAGGERYRIRFEKVIDNEVKQ